MATDAPADAARRAGATLTIDLAAIRENYRRLRTELAGVRCGAAVKADAYGLGIEKVGPALYQAGARDFFVALPEEGLQLLEVLGRPGDTMVVVLNGLLPGTEPDLAAAGLVPALNSLDEIDRWRSEAHRRGTRLPALVHVDTGMCRLGLPSKEVGILANDHTRLDGLELRYVMSHLVSAEDRSGSMSAEQLAAFHAAREGLPASRASFANSSGIFLGPDFHFDLARPGVALYGVNPLPGAANPMAQAVHLQGKILQVRDVDAPQTVGYGATYRVQGPGRIATVAVGYADGYLRSLSNRGKAIVDGRPVAVVGRVSMDLITLDVSAIAPERAVPGALVDLIGPDNDLDSLAEEAGTIGYELLTALGRRYHRAYMDSPLGDSPLGDGPLGDDPKLDGRP